jgi:type IV pilus assembly protein PilX
MPSLRHHPRPGRLPTRRRQRGVVMIFTLIALVLILIAVAAVVRSVDSTTTVIGNLAFRRDLTNRAELGIAQALAALKTGSLSTETAQTTNLVSAHYSATRLATPSGGIGVPAVLVRSSSSSTAGYSCIDGSGNALASCNTPGPDGIVIRWVIDRQCVSGTTTMDTSKCAYLKTNRDKGGSAPLAGLKPNGSSRGLFRISVRVSGPRGNEAYIQTTAG